MNHRSKAFTEALQCLSSDPAKAKRYLQDKRPTLPEKRIIKAGLQLRDNDFEIIIESLTSFTAADAYIESQRLLILGITYNNKSEFKKATELLEESYRVGKGTRGHQREFVTLYNLFNAYSNRHDEKRMQIYFEKLNTLGSKSVYEAIALGLCQLEYHLIKNDLVKAKALSEDLNPSMPMMIEHQKIFFILKKCSIFLQLNELPAAYSCIAELKSHRKYQTSSNYKFIKSLTQYLEKDAPFYIYESDFAEAQELFHQMNVIKAISEGDHKTASLHWHELQETNPEVYRADFVFKGIRGLFMIALNKALSETTFNTNVVVASGGTKEEKFLEVLKQNKGPLSKVIIYEILYGKKPTLKSDFLKLAALASNVRKKFGVSIQTRKGCYYLAS